MKNDIQNREDVNLLVRTFYTKIRQDDLLGPIFNRMIPEEAWPEHLEKLTDFWETNLFGIRKFKGNPTHKHIKTDKAFDYTISKKHFNQWLCLWKGTVNVLFEGDKATRALMAAFNIADVQNAIIDNNKPVAKT